MDRRVLSVVQVVGVLAAGMVLAGVPAAQAAEPVPSVAPAAPAGAVDVVVQVVPGADPRAVAEGDADRVFAQALHGFSATVDADGLAGLEADPRVLAVEVDQVVQLTGTQSPVTWGLDRTDQRTLPLSGGLTLRSTGAGATVYVVDEGIDATHAEFGGRVRGGYTAVADGRGTNDCSGHGTHVAGTAVGATHGIARGATAVPVRIFDCAGRAPLSGILAGLDWLVRDHQAGVPAVANMSFGADASTILDDAVRAVVADGVSVVAAAGNDELDACGGSPGRVPAVLTVGATDRADRRPWWSNYGRCLDLFAPGVEIRSAEAFTTTRVVEESGTSMAAPHASGVLAVVRAEDPALSASAAVARVVAAATPGLVGDRGAGSPDRLLSLSPAATSAECPVGDDRTPAARQPRPGVVVPRRTVPARYDLFAVSSTGPAAAVRVDGLDPSVPVVATWENRAGCSGVDASRAAWAVTPAGKVYGEVSPAGPPAANVGDASGLRLARPVVGMSPTASGAGYWLVAGDGGIFTYGDARFHGSTGALRLAQPIVGMATTPTGRGYWLVASDGGIFTFGDARFFGSTGALRLQRPVKGMLATPTGRGYWLVASDGGVFTFGDAVFHGSTGGRSLPAPVAGMLARPGGYTLVGADGTLYPFGG